MIHQARIWLAADQRPLLVDLILGPILAILFLGVVGLALVFAEVAFWVVRHR